MKNYIPVIKKVKNTIANIGFFLEELFYFEQKTTKKERVLFYILKESVNNRTVFLKSVVKRLSWIKPCIIQAAQNIVKDLNKQGLISLVKDCPNCKTGFIYLPTACPNCGMKLILQEITFKGKSYRPRFSIEITEEGKKYVSDLIKSYNAISSFFIAWNSYVSLKAQV